METNGIELYAKDYYFKELIEQGSKIKVYRWVIIMD